MPRCRALDQASAYIVTSCAKTGRINWGRPGVSALSGRRHPPGGLPSSSVGLIGAACDGRNLGCMRRAVFQGRHPVARTAHREQRFSDNASNLQRGCAGICAPIVQFRCRVAIRSTYFREVSFLKLQGVDSMAVRINRSGPTSFRYSCFAKGRFCRSAAGFHNRDHTYGIQDGAVLYGVKMTHIAKYT